MDVPKTGRLIAEARRGQGLTQRELAERLHVSDRAVSKWERGLNLPEAALFEPLCQSLGITVTELLRGEREEPTLPALEQAVDEAVALAGEETRRKRGYRRAALVLAVLLLAAAALIGRPWWERYQRQRWAEQDSVIPAVSVVYWNGLEKHITLYPLPCGMYGPFRSDGSLFSARMAVTFPWGALPQIQSIEIERPHQTLQLQLDMEKRGMEVEVLRWPKDRIGACLGLEDGEKVPVEPAEEPVRRDWDGPAYTVRDAAPGYLYSVVVRWGDGYYVECPFLVP